MAKFIARLVKYEPGQINTTNRETASGEIPPPATQYAVQASTRPPAEQPSIPLPVNVENNGDEAVVPPPPTKYEVPPTPAAIVADGTASPPPSRYGGPPIRYATAATPASTTTYMTAPTTPYGTRSSGG